MKTKLQLKPLVYSLLLASAGMQLSACGGGSSSSSPTGSSTPVSDTQTNSSQLISGYVMDPAIENAQVSLCHISMPTDCLDYKTLTDDRGFYSFEIDSSVSLDGYAVYSLGGTDAATGESLSNLKFSSPVDLTNSQSTTYVTPLTTLVTQYQYDNGSDLETAQNAIAEKLELTPDQLTSATDASHALVTKALVLTQIAKNRTNGLEDIEDIQGSGDEFLNAAIESLEDQTAQNTLHILTQRLTETSSVDAAISEFILSKNLLETDAFSAQDLADEQVQTNFAKVANAMSALTQIENSAQVEVLAALMNLSTLDLAAADFTVPDIDTSNIDLENIKVERLYNHQQPLAQAPEDKEALRDYYYQSTASQLAKASELVKGITDVDTLEAVYEGVAEGYLNAGYDQYALSLANRNFFKAETEFTLLLEVAKQKVSRAQGELSDSERSEIETLLDKSFTLFKAYLESKGLASTDKDDVYHLKYLMDTYALAGLNDKASGVTTYLQSIVGSFADDYLPFSAYVVGMVKRANAYIETGELELARSTLAEASEIAKIIPPNNKAKYPDTPEKWSYKAKLFYLDQVAEVYYWNLGAPEDKAKAMELIEEIKAVRADDGLISSGSNSTVYNTDIYLSNYIIPMLADYGLSQTDFDALIVTMQRDTYIQRAHITYAVYGDLSVQAAIQSIKDNTDSYDDTLNYLTYNGINKGTAYLALHYLEQGDYENALTTLNSAVEILDEAVTNGEESTAKNRIDEYVRYGYAKLAELYFSTGDLNRANELMQIAIAIADNSATAPANTEITDIERRVYAYNEIVRQYYQMGDVTNGLVYAAKSRTLAAEISDMADRVSRLSELAENVTTSDESTLAFKNLVLDDLWQILSSTEITLGDSQQEDLVEKVSEIFDKSSSSYSFSGGLIGDYLSVGNQQGVIQAARTLVEFGDMIADSSNQMDAYLAAVYAYALIGDVDSAKAVINDKMALKANQLEALRFVAYAVTKQDAFPACSVASVDYDLDGLPDFYQANASQEEIDACGLELDYDSDNDGLADTEDTQPFYAQSQ